MTSIGNLCKSVVAIWLGLTLACAMASDKWIWRLSPAGRSVGGVTAWTAPFPRPWSIPLWLVAGGRAFAAGAVEWRNASRTVTFCTTGPDAMSPAAKWRMAFAALLAFAGFAQARAWPERIVRVRRGGWIKGISPQPAKRGKERGPDE